MVISKHSTTWLLYRLARFYKIPSSKLPDFLMIGVQKGGTTALYDYLFEHPCVLPPISKALKELHFFNNDENYSKGIDWYRKQFPPVWIHKYISQKTKRPVITGESTPGYLFWPKVPTRVHDTLPQSTKFIAVLRDPIERAFSHYQHNRKRSVRSTNFSFSEIIRIESELIVKNETQHPELGIQPSYISRGFYYEQIQRWLQYFPRNNFLFLNSHELLKAPQIEIKKVYDFLGLDENKLTNTSPIHTGNYTDSMDRESYEFLVSTYKEHNRKLFNFLGEDWGWPT